MKPHEIFQLNEVAMSPTALRTMASKVDARVGIEFEMIVSDLKFDNEDDADDYWTPELDFSSDREPESIDDIVSFFDEDVNEARELKRLRKELETLLKQRYEEYFQNNGMGFFMHWIDENPSGIQFQTEAYTSYLENNSDYDSDEIEAIAQAIVDSHQYAPAVRDEKMAKNKYYQMYLDDKDGIDGGLREEIKQSFNSDWIIFNEAFSDWQDSEITEEDEQAMFKEMIEDSGFDLMSDIQSNYSGYISWPHYEEKPQADLAELEDLTYDFSDGIDMPVTFSTSYHGGERKPGRWVIEPDNSLTPDDYSDTGMEFVSPIIMLQDMPEIMGKVVQWAKRRGCYTNNSTGLHMNVSIAGKDFRNLDYTKLVLFLGDQYVLKQFGRQYSTYCVSAMSKLEGIIDKALPGKVEQLLDLVKNTSYKAASQMIHGNYTDKYTSVHLHPDQGYVEFRSPGGDWLNEDLPKLINTLYRFVVALDIAMDPSKYQREYATKLYKLISPVTDDTPFVSYMTKYQAGLITKSEFIAAVTKNKQLPSSPDKMVKYQIVLRDAGSIMVSFVAPPQNAMKTAKSWLLAHGRRPSLFDLVNTETDEHTPVTTDTILTQR